MTLWWSDLLGMMQSLPTAELLPNTLAFLPIFLTYHTHSEVAARQLSRAGRHADRRKNSVGSSLRGIFKAAAAGVDVMISDRSLSCRQVGGRFKHTKCMAPRVFLEDLARFLPFS
jgi:hypothetical protein